MNLTRLLALAIVTNQLLFVATRTFGITSFYSCGPKLAFTAAAGLTLILVLLQSNLNRQDDLLFFITSSSVLVSNAIFLMLSIYSDIAKYRTQHDVARSMVEERRRHRELPADFARYREIGMGMLTFASGVCLGSGHQNVAMFSSFIVLIVSRYPHWTH